MVQQLKTNKANYEGQQKYGYEVIGKRMLNSNQQRDFIYSNMYYTVNRQRMEDKQFDQVGLNGVARSGLKCYISFDINNLVFNGLESGGERFNYPYDYFKQAMIHITPSGP